MANEATRLEEVAVETSGDGSTSKRSPLLWAVLAAVLGLVVLAVGIGIGYGIFTATQGGSAPSPQDAENQPENRPIAPATASDHVLALAANLFPLSGGTKGPEAGSAPLWDAADPCRPLERLCGIHRLQRATDVCANVDAVFGAAALERAKGFIANETWIYCGDSSSPAGFQVELEESVPGTAHFPGACADPTA
eukprot:jgi/Tetstr1/454880/TSEL_041744.t1